MLRRLQAINRVDWNEIDRVVTEDDLNKLGPKYNRVAPLIKRKIACVLRRKTPLLKWKPISRLIGGTYNTFRLWSQTVSGFSEYYLRDDRTLQEGARIVGPRNPRLEIALICHVNSCNDAGFLLDYHLFETEALIIDSRLRLEANQLNISYGESQFVCSRDYYQKFKARNQFRVRRANGEAASVFMERGTNSN